MRNQRYIDGFTVVELLITLFVAVAFLVSGYQLFNAVIKDGGQTRSESKASNTAYDYLRRYSSVVTNPCVSSTPVNDEAITVAGLGAATARVDVSCPYTSNPSVSKVDVTITYSNGKTVKYTTLATGIGYVTDTVTPVGLVGWWKFNGNASTSVGTANGVVTGATLTTGQGGQLNTAYNFSAACCQYITTSAIPALPPTLTISAWIYPIAYPSERAAIVVSPAASDGYYFSLNSDGSLQSYWYGTSSPGYHTTPAGTVPLNQWSFVSVTWSGAQVKLYINGLLRSTASTGGGGAAAGLIYIGAQASSSSRQFAGRIDDLRMYNRTLTDIDISNLYAEGAQ